MAKRDLRKLGNRQARLDSLYALAVLLMAILFITNLLDVVVSYVVYSTNQELFLRNELNKNVIADFQKWDNSFQVIFFVWLMPLLALCFIIFIIAFRIKTTYFLKYLFRVIFIIILVWLNYAHIIGFLSWCIV